MAEEALRRSYVQPDGAMEMDKNILNKPARYRPCWASYNGAMAGLLASQGIDCDVAEVAGRSGYAFVTNVFEGRLCASGPTALGIETWVQMREGTESLGYKLEHWTDYSAEPRGEAPSVKELEKMKRLFDRVRNEIDQGRPAVLWGIAVPEYGLVNGYEGDSYIVSSFRGAIGMPDGPVKYHELDAPGCYDAYFIKGRNERKEVAKEMLSRALRFATGEVRSEKGYVNGPQAFLAWADALEPSAVDERSYMSNAYVGACAQEAKGLASTFLGRLAKSTGYPEMSVASQAYADLSAHLQKFTALFPFEQEGNLTPTDRKTGAALLREAYGLEMNAVSSLSRAREALD
jgi:hypothetical protein